MSDEEQRKLAKMIAEELAGDSQPCPLGITDESAKALMHFARWWMGIQRAGMFTIIGILLIGFVSVFIIGIIEKFSMIFEKIIGK